jgi:hypothetical protein
MNAQNVAAVGVIAALRWQPAGRPSWREAARAPGHEHPHHAHTKIMFTLADHPLPTEAPEQNGNDND